MLVDILLAAVLVALAAAGVLVWVRRAASCGRPLDVAASEPDQVFWGGVMCRYLITSGLLARLELFDWGVRVRGTMLSRWLVPTWVARYDELAIAERVTLPWSRIAVWFRLRGAEPGGIGFLSERSEEILRALERHEVPVDRAVAQVRRVDELYGPSR